MNWEKLSEKLSKDKRGEYIMIFCDPEDATDPFVQDKMSQYQSKGFRVVVRHPDEEDKKHGKKDKN